MIFKLKKPDLSKIDDRRIFKLLDRYKELGDIVLSANHPVYLYWDKVKYKPHPVDISTEELWALIKFTRNNFMLKTISVVRKEDGNYFHWVKLPVFEEFFHDVDLNLGGSLTMSKDIDEKQKNRFIARGIMEEAIASSQLEGANTTREAAKMFLREKRRPSNIAEQMILNNYTTMKLIEYEYRNQKLTKEILFRLHDILTKNTINEAKIGRFRKDSEDIVVSDEKGVIYHIPPREKFINEEIERFIAFANDELNESPFIHPIIKAIILHFWLGYLHPFLDGNGRLARAIFYWYLLRRGYWAFAYLPISKIIKNSPVQYRDAYIHSEQDDYDLTYFIDYNIRKIKQAMKEFEEYCRLKREESSKISIVARTKYHLRDRQIQLIRFLFKNKDQNTTIKAHMNINEISRLTATKDLKELEKLGFIFSRKIRKGKGRYFFGTDKINEIIK